MADITLSPNSLGGGDLPSGYDTVTFNMGDGYWIDRITLPKHPINNSKVNITSQATYASYVIATPVDAPWNGFFIRSGVNYVFVYDAAAGKWKAGGSSIKNLTPNDAGSVLPDNPTTITMYSMYDGNWAPTIQLPKLAKHNDLVAIHSVATYDSKVLSDNLLYASSTIIKTNDYYVFRYSGASSRWVVESCPVRIVDQNHVNPMSPPIAPRTLIGFYDGNWSPQIVLPATAGDRDIITIKSSATFGSTIAPTNVGNPAAMDLNTGDEYEFFYSAPSGKWMMVRFPEPVYQMQNLAGGKLPALTKPRTIVYASDGNWGPTLTLPAGQPTGTRVLVKSAATYSFSVLADNNSFQVNTGNTVSFRSNASKLWEKETPAICDGVGAACDA